MKSNRVDNTPSRTVNVNLRETLLKEKEALVTMFLSSASHNELSEQIKKIDELCSKLDNQHKGGLRH